MLSAPDACLAAWQSRLRGSLIPRQLLLSYFPFFLHIDFFDRASRLALSLIVSKCTAAANAIERHHFLRPSPSSTPN
ncbi:unnamed protein product [Urochloa humidicola]